MEAERKTQRARRQERQSIAAVALVGYTNAGKSTLMRALTGSEVLVANKLFATLDTTVRALYPESVPRVLVSDTVGFIKNLPHGLVASFKSTLDEALDASLLLHVIDASDPGFERQLAVTDKVLEEIGADVVPRIRVFNKIDHVGDAAAQAECEAALRAKYPDCVVMSARRPDEVARLRQTIVTFSSGIMSRPSCFCLGLLNSYARKFLPVARCWRNVLTARARSFRSVVNEGLLMDCASGLRWRDRTLRKYEPVHRDRGDICCFRGQPENLPEF
jgi:50S ribosomal subunit-associated GTPase HflX